VRASPTVTVSGKGHTKPHRWGTVQGTSDLLVDPPDKTRFVGCSPPGASIAALAPRPQRLPGVESYFGWIAGTGTSSMVHCTNGRFIGRPGGGRVGPADGRPFVLASAARARVPHPAREIELIALVVPTSSGTAWRPPCAPPPDWSDAVVRRRGAAATAATRASASSSPVAANAGSASKKGASRNGTCSRARPVWSDRSVARVASFLLNRVGPSGGGAAGGRQAVVPLDRPDHEGDQLDFGSRDAEPRSPCGRSEEEAFHRQGPRGPTRDAR